MNVYINMTDSQCNWDRDKTVERHRNLEPRDDVRTRRTSARCPATEWRVARPILWRCSKRQI